MTTKTINATVPAQVKIEASAVLAVLDVHGMGMAAFLREMMAAVATRDAQTLAWIEQARL